MSPKDKYLDVDYRVRCFEEMLHRTNFYADAVPYFHTAIAPGDLALFAGACPQFSQDTVWFDPVVDDITQAEIPSCQPKNEYWKTALDLMRKGMTHLEEK